MVQCHLSPLSLIFVSLPPPLSQPLSLHREQIQNPTIPPPTNHQQHNLPPPSSTTQPATNTTINNSNNKTSHHHHQQHNHHPTTAALPKSTQKIITNPKPKPKQNPKPTVATTTSRCRHPPTRNPLQHKSQPIKNQHTMANHNPSISIHEE